MSELAWRKRLGRFEVGSYQGLPQSELARDIRAAIIEVDRLAATLRAVDRWLERGRIQGARTIIAHALDPDPWMSEPLTEKERAATDKAKPPEDTPK
jgi:hypothetical protein